LISALDIDKINDYTKEDFTQDEEKFDFIFDALGKNTFGKCTTLLKLNSVYISSKLGPNWQNILYALLTAKSKNKKVIFPIPLRRDKTISYICFTLNQGKFRPLVDRA
jgi:NADPH:quinone reductase-like Zn-dependent oxidoreductase